MVPYSGTNTGQIIVGIDDMGDHFRGCAYAYDNNKALPGTFAIINSTNPEAFGVSTAYPLMSR
jgi:hypothetical protein